MSANDGLASGVEYKWNGKEWAPVPKPTQKPTPSIPSSVTTTTTTFLPYRRPPFTTTSTTPTRPNASRIGNASVSSSDVSVSQARVFSPFSRLSTPQRAVQSSTPNPEASKTSTSTTTNSTTSTTSTAINQTILSPSRTISNNKTINNSKAISNAQRRNLANALRVLRQRYATKVKKEPYKIFPNAALESIVEHLPSTKDELLDCHGFGPKRVHNIGDSILQIISLFRASLHKADNTASTSTSTSNTTTKSNTNTKTNNINSIKTEQTQTLIIQTNIQKQTLREKIRQFRLSISKTNNKPPYCVFHDSTLNELMERLPTTQKDLLKVKGIGKQKLDEFGSALLGLIREYKKNVKKLTAATAAAAAKSGKSKNVKTTTSGQKKNTTTTPTITTVFTAMNTTNATNSSTSTAQKKPDPPGYYNGIGSLNLTRSSSNNMIGSTPIGTSTTNSTTTPMPPSLTSQLFPPTIRRPTSTAPTTNNKPVNNNDGDGEIVFMAEQSVHDIVEAKFAEAAKTGNVIEL